MTSRRQFLHGLGRIGGYSAVSVAMQSLGLLAATAAPATPFALPPGSGKAGKPEDRVVFAGEHLSWLPAWQEGAALSAQAAITLLAGMAAEKRMTTGG